MSANNYAIEWRDDAVRGAETSISGWEALGYPAVDTAKRLFVLRTAQFTDYRAKPGTYSDTFWDPDVVTPRAA